MTGVAPPQTLALALDGITKRFGSIVALNGANLQVRAGSVHALLGENGAGKTTLIRIAFGLLRADGGTVAIHGNAEPLRSPADAIARGMGVVHQHFTNVPAMTVAENVALGNRGVFSARRTSQRIVDFAKRLHLPLDPEARVDNLGAAAQQRLEIVKALFRDARLLILDEPTAVLAPREATELLQWLRAYADTGGTAVLITHKLREALAIADEVTVLRHGRTTLQASTGHLTQEVLAREMIGDSVPSPRGDSDATPGAPIVSVRAVSITNEDGTSLIRHASFVVRRREIVGMAGVEGSGQAALLRALAGRMPIHSGEIERPDVVGFVPEDRQRDALVLEFSLTENVALGNAASLRGTVQWHAWRLLTDKILSEDDVRAPSPESSAGQLSGGNQQKLVIGRELRLYRDFLVVENPTRGLDLRARAAVHDRLRAARDDGMGIVLYSSDLDEVLSLAARVLVVHAGRVIETSLDREAIGRAMLGIS